MRHGVTGNGFAGTGIARNGTMVNGVAGSGGLFQNDWIRAFLLSLIFVGLLLAIQYPLSGFLLESTGARNWFFGAESWYFGNSPDAHFRYRFRSNELQPLPLLAEGIGIAVLLGLLISRLSLRWGKWMQRIQR